MGKIDSYAQTLAASNTLASPLDSYAKRIKRVQKQAAEEVYYRLKNRQHTTGPVFAERVWEDAEAARGMRDGIEEFKKLHPKYGAELGKIINQQRKVRRNYVSFEFDTLPESAYYQVLQDVGIPKEMVEDTLRTIIDMSEHLKELKQPIQLLMG
jgi:hypothetical protein